MRAAALSLLLALGACAQWPAEGTGGLAELRPDPGSERLSCVMEDVSALGAAAAEAGRGTGQALLLREGAVRALRESRGSLSHDASRTMDRIGAESAALRRLLGRPTGSGCA